MILKKYLETDSQIARLSCSEFEGEGELTEIAPYAFHNHRELQEVFLPAGIREIGAHAFYDCRNLRKLSFYDKVEDLGDGVLRNCTKLSYLEIKSAGGNLIALKDILLNHSDRLIVNLYGNEIVFPYYQEQYMDYYEARIIKQINHGAGIDYRECLNREEFDYASYDDLFRIKKYSMEEEEGVLLAKSRLEYPHKLKEEARKEYLAYLLKNLDFILRGLVLKRDIEELNSFLKTGLFDEKEILDRATDFLCDKEFAEGVGKLMEFRDSKFEKTSVLDLEL